MLISDEVVEHMLIDLRHSQLFLMPGTPRPMLNLWSILNGILLELRMPLYHHRRLGKKKLKPAHHHLAVQRAMAILASFAQAIRTNQAIVSCLNGYAQSISFQPRPHNLQWNAIHAIDPPELVESHHTEQAESVLIEDMLHLTAKIVYAVSGHNAGEIPDCTATFVFLQSPQGGPQSRLIVRDLIGSEASRHAHYPDY